MLSRRVATVVRLTQGAMRRAYGTGTEPASRSLDRLRHETRVKLSPVRQRLKESQNTTAFLTTFQEIDVSGLLELRRGQQGLEFEGSGLVAAFARACCRVLREMPEVNASIEGDEIIYRDYVDIQVSQGVVRNADSLSFAGFEAALDMLSKDGPEDVSGGTFTISNVHPQSLFGQNIITLPQTATLGIHAIKDKVVLVGGKTEVRPVVTVGLTYDHRLLDGREGTTFLVKIKKLIEDPRELLLV